MRLFLVRHAHADPGDPDALRPLSARGSQEARRLGEQLAAVRPETVVSSPLLRARQTAAAIANAAGAELRVDDRLAPGASVDVVLETVEDAGAIVVAVGHQPDCSEVAAALGAGDVDFPPAGAVEIEIV